MNGLVRSLYCVRHRALKFLLASFICCGVGARSLEAQDATSSSGQSAVPASDSQTGEMAIEVVFGSDGKVQNCRLVRSNAPYALEHSTLDYIRNRWGGPFFADSSEVVRIIYDEPPTAGYWNGELALPPNLFPDDGHQHEVMLRISFDNEGWVKGCKVLLSSGIELADAQTAAWIKVHWHSDSYANKVVDAPFVFQRTEHQPVTSMLQPKSVDLIDLPVAPVTPSK